MIGRRSGADHVDGLLASPPVVRVMGRLAIDGHRLPRRHLENCLHPAVKARLELLRANQANTCPKVSGEGMLFFNSRNYFSHPYSTILPFSHRGQTPLLFRARFYVRSPCFVTRFANKGAKSWYNNSSARPGRGEEGK